MKRANVSRASGPAMVMAPNTQVTSSTEAKPETPAAACSSVSSSAAVPALSQTTMTRSGV